MLTGTHAARSPRRAPMEAVQGAAVEAVLPLFRTAVDAAEGALLRMHAQDWGGSDAPDVARPSPYMADLTRHLAHCRRASPPPRVLVDTRRKYTSLCRVSRRELRRWPCWA